MKKVMSVLMVVMMFVTLNVSALQAGYLPVHTNANTVADQNKKRVNVVYENNNDSTEDIVYGFLVAASIAEDSDFYLYPMYGDMPALRVEFNKECIEKIMKEYTKIQSVKPEINPCVTAFEDLIADTITYVDKEVIVYGRFLDAHQAELGEIMESYPDIHKSHMSPFSYSDVFGDLPERLISNIHSSSALIDYYLEQYGYESVPGDYYSYDSKLGTVMIDQGKADANIVVHAYSQKDDLLYISGYMVTEERYQDKKNAKTISGVSLGYNQINVEKTTSPKNNAFALFSLDESLYSVVENSFVIPVKNAEYVRLYYKSDMGIGVCSETATYNRQQDDAIKNMNAPVETEENEASVYDNSKSVINKLKLGQNNETESDNLFIKILKVIGRILLIVLQIAWLLFRWFILIAIILMIVNKNVRKNFTGRIMNSKLGPLIERIAFKLRQLWAAITKTEPPIEGIKKEDKHYVFISHSSKDRRIPNNRIETVVRELKNRNIECWLSDKEITAGQNYGKVLSKAIENCSVFLVFLSEASAASDEVKREMTLATKYKRPIVPVQIEKTDIINSYEDWEYWLSISQVKFLYSNAKEGIDALAAEVGEIYRIDVPDFDAEEKQLEEKKTEDNTAEA